MTENMKKYLEVISKDEEAKKKLADYEARVKAQSVKDIIAYAEAKGITLTEADFANEPELSEDELDAVAGGDNCVCPIGGGGKYTKHESGVENLTCACVLGGGGEYKDLQGKKHARCVCVGAGTGEDYQYASSVDIYDRIEFGRG